MSAAAVVYVDENGATLPGRPGTFGIRNRERAAMYARAEFYAWSARRFDGCPIPGNDPVTGRPHGSYVAARGWERTLGRAMDRAAAAACYRMARAYPSPLPAGEVAA